MSEPDPNERLKQLEERIAAAKKAEEGARHQDEHYSKAQQGWRMVIEMVAGVLIGFGMGFGLDSLFGTIPIFLVLFTLLGFAAGVKTMMRSAEELQRQTLADQAEDISPPDGDEKRAKDGG